ncbi:MAG: Ig-like domain-containing protein [Clostridia bacterium]|jgi:uncharacterized protein YjdB
MFCENCGKQNPDDTKFCTNCGFKQEVTEEQPSVQKPMQPQVIQPQSVQPQVIQPQSVQPQVIQPQPVPPQVVQQPQAFQQQPVQSQAFQQQPVAVKKPKKVMVPILIAIAVIIVALAGIIVYGYFKSTPEAAANNYVTALMNKDAEKFVENYYIPPGTSQADINQLKTNIKDIDTSKIDKTSLKVYSTRPSEFKGTLQTSLQLNSGGTIEDFKVVFVSVKADNKVDFSAMYMVKQGKSFFIFDKWVVITNQESSETVTGVTIDKSTASMNAGGTLQLNANVTPANATNKAVTWKSSDENIAAVSSEGVVTAKKKGNATITVTTTEGSMAATCIITVNQPVKSVKLNKKTVTIKVGKFSKLIATINPSDASNKKVIWRSTNKRIVTVSATGVIKGVKKGIAYIKVFTADGNKTAKCKITVN